MALKDHFGKIYQLSQAVSKGASIFVDGNSYTAMDNINPGRVVLADGYIIPGNLANSQTLTETSAIYRHTRPVEIPINPIRCYKLKAGYVYSVKKPGDKAEIFLVDTDNEVHKIHTINSVTNYNYDAQYTYFVTSPPGSYTIYSSGITYSYRGGSLTGKAIVDMVYLRNRETDPLLPFDTSDGRTTTGSQESSTSEVTRSFGLSTTANIPSVEGNPTNIDYLLWPIVKRLENDFSEVVFDPATSWSSGLSDGVDGYSAQHIPSFSITTYESLSGISTAPYQLAGFHYGAPNPQVTDLGTVTIDGETYRRRFVQYGLAYWNWTGGISTSPGSGGDRPPPVPELPRFEVFTSYHQGNVYILIRTSGDRPESQNAGAIGYEEDPPWKSFHAYKFNTREKTKESIAINQLPFYMIPLGERGIDSSSIVKGLRSDPLFDYSGLRETYTTSTMALQAYYIEVVEATYWGGSAYRDVRVTNFSAFENPIVNPLIDSKVQVYGWATIGVDLLYKSLLTPENPSYSSDFTYYIFPIELFNTAEVSDYDMSDSEYEYQDLGWIHLEPEIVYTRDQETLISSNLPLRDTFYDEKKANNYEPQPYTKIPINLHPDATNLKAKSELPSGHPDYIVLDFWGTYINFTDNTINVCHNPEGIKPGTYRHGSDGNYDPEFPAE